MSARTIITSVLFLVAIAAAWYVGKEYSGVASGEPKSVVEPAEDPAVTTIHGQGKLQPAAGLIKIVAAPGEKIAEQPVDSVGTRVSKDQVLAILESRKGRKLELELARAKLQDAETTISLEEQLGQFKEKSADLAVGEADSIEETVEAKAQNVSLLRKRLALAQSMLSRLENLKANPATKQLVNQTEVDQQTLAVQQIESQLAELQIELASAKDRAVRAKQAAINNLESVKLAIAKADTQVPQNTLERTIELAQLAYEMTELKSPIDGVVLDIIVREGDTVANQPVMVLGNTEEMVCVAEINDTLLRFVVVGATVRMSSGALSQPLTGVVIEKGMMIGPPSMSDPNPYASVDRATGKVTIQLDEASSVLASRFVNLQVDVEIDKRIPPDQASQETE